MARKRMVTRTVMQTTAEVMALDITTAEVQVLSYNIGGQYNDEELLKKLQSLFQTDTLKLVHIESQTTKRYYLAWMRKILLDLQKYCLHAQQIKTRTRGNPSTSLKE